MFASTVISARRLLVDDHFMFAGAMYRISELEIDREQGLVRVVAYNLSNKSETIKVELKTNMRMTIQNQRY